MYRFLGVTLILLGMALPVAAQQKLTETFTLATEAGTLTLDYPAEWIVDESDAGASYVAIHNQALTQTPRPTALIEIAITAPIDLGYPADYQTPNLPADYFEDFQTRQSTALFSDVIPVRFADYTGALMAFSDTGPTLSIYATTKVSLGIAIELDTATLLIIEFQASEDIADDMWPLWGAMLESLTWDSKTLVDDEVRAQYQDLVAMPQVSSIIGLEAGRSVVAFLPPQHWTVQVSDDNVQFEQRDAQLEIRWLPMDNPDLNQLLQHITAADETDLNAFVWGPYPAAAITYRDDERWGLRLALVLPDGLLQLQVESRPETWLAARRVLLATSSRLAIDGTYLEIDPLLDASRALQSP